MGIFSLQGCGRRNRRDHNQGESVLSGLIFWDPKGQESGKSMKEEVEKKHDHLIFPFIHVKSSCSDKLHFQRHMCKTRVPKKTCDRTGLAELTSSWIASGTVCASL